MQIVRLPGVPAGIEARPWRVLVFLGLRPPLGRSCARAGRVPLALPTTVPEPERASNGF